MNMTATEMADRLVLMFGLEGAKEYVTLWQEEFTTEQDRLFRQEVKGELSNR